MDDVTFHRFVILVENSLLLCKVDRYLPLIMVNIVEVWRHKRKRWQITMIMLLHKMTNPWRRQGVPGGRVWEAGRGGADGELVRLVQRCSLHHRAKGVNQGVKWGGGRSRLLDYKGILLRLNIPTGKMFAMFYPTIHTFLPYWGLSLLFSFYSFTFVFCLQKKNVQEMITLIGITWCLNKFNLLQKILNVLNNICCQQDSLPPSLASLSFQIQQLIKRPGIWSDVLLGGGGGVNICYFLVCSQISTCYKFWSRSRGSKSWWERARMPGESLVHRACGEERASESPPQNPWTPLDPRAPPPISLPALPSLMPCWSPWGFSSPFLCGFERGSLLWPQSVFCCNPALSLCPCVLSRPPPPPARAALSSPSTSPSFSSFSSMPPPPPRPGWGWR